MANKFSGFQTAADSLTGIPDNFFLEILPSINDLDLLKLCLYLLWKGNTLGDYGHPITNEAIRLDKIFTESIGEGRTNKEDLIDALLEQAVEKQLLLAANEGTAKLQRYFINCEAGRKALAENNPSHLPSATTLDQVKPNIYKQYTENIGPLTPLIADALRDAESEYPLEWIAEAMEIAVKNNVRRWRYIETILDRWQKEGRNGTDQKDNKTDYRSYIND